MSERGQHALGAVPGRAGEAAPPLPLGVGLTPHAPQSLPGQSYEVQMFCNCKLGDATQWPRLLKVGAPLPDVAKAESAS